MYLAYGCQRHEVKTLYNIFKNKFAGKVDEDLFRTICVTFLTFINIGTYEHLENFVKEFFVMRGIIVENRNELIDFIQSDEFKKENLFNRIRIKKELKYWQNLCENLREFEDEFFQRTYISLLRVENERWAKEKEHKAKEMQSIKQ